MSSRSNNFQLFALVLMPLPVLVAQFAGTRVGISLYLVLCGIIAWKLLSADKTRYFYVVFKTDNATGNKYIIAPNGNYVLREFVIADIKNSQSGISTNAVIITAIIELSKQDYFDHVGADKDSDDE